MMPWLTAQLTGVPKVPGDPGYATRGETILGWALLIVIALFVYGYIWWSVGLLFKPKRSGSVAYNAEFSRNRQVALARDGHRCRMCGRPGTAAEPLHVHHQIPRARGGSNDPSNLVTLCPYHHGLMHHR